MPLKLSFVNILYFDRHFPEIEHLSVLEMNVALDFLLLRTPPSHQIGFKANLRRLRGTNLF